MNARSLRSTPTAPAPGARPPQPHPHRQSLPPLLRHRQPGGHSHHCPVAGKDIWLGSTPGVYRLRRSAANAGGFLVAWRRPGRCPDHPTSPIIDLTAARRTTPNAQGRCLSPPPSRSARFLTVAAGPRRGTCRRPRSTGRAGPCGGSGRHLAPRRSGPGRCARPPAAAPSASPAAPGAGSA